MKITKNIYMYTYPENNLHYVEGFLQMKKKKKKKKKPLDI